MTYREHQRLAYISDAVKAIRSRLHWVQGTVENDLPELEAAVRRLSSRLSEPPSA